MSMKSIRKGALDRINKLQGKDGDKIGVITYWSCRGSIPVGELRALFKKHKLPDEWLPPDIRESAAFRKAINAARGKVPGYLLRPIVDTDEKIVWGVVKETIDEVNVDLHHDTEAKVIFRKRDGAVNVKGSGEAAKLARIVKDSYDGLTEVYISRDLQRMLKRNIGRDMGSVTLRDGGGFYFTPPRFLPLIEKHKAVIEEIGGSSLGILVLNDHEANKATVGGDTRRSLEEQLVTIKTELEEFRTSNPREKTLAEKLEEYKSLKARCDTYADMLGIQVDDLKTGINDCAQQMRALLGEVQLANENKDEERKERRREQAKKLREEAKAMKERAQIRRVRKVQR